MNETDARMALAAMRDAVETWESSHDDARIYWHADGSATVVYRDPYPGDSDSPRDYDGNVAALVNESRDYSAMDEPDAGLAAARDRWDWLEQRSHGSYGRGPLEVQSWHTAADRALIRAGYDRADIVARYVAIFRPDILHYEDEWTVSGYMQSDWQRGYGYVTADAWRAAMGADYAGDVTPADGFAQELAIYELWFRGELYCAVHLELGAPIVAYGEHGAYVDGYNVAEDGPVCGFLGYEDLADIARGFTDSPVVDSAPEQIGRAS